MDFEIPLSGIMEVTMKRIRIGTRGSKLALRQAEMVREAIERKHSEIETEIVVLHTQGDKILDKPLVEIGDKGVFVSEFEQALLAGEIDLAVHSAKDLPERLAEGLCIAAVLPRGDVRDVLVVPKGGRVPRAIGDSMEAEENEGEAEEGQRTFVIGTGSRRRRRQVGQFWADVTCKDIRGNVDTRLQKLKNSGGNRTEHGGADGSGTNDKAGDMEPGNVYVTGYDGLILAKAGLDRLEIMLRYGNAFDFYPLAPEQFLPAACQGIIAVEAVQDSEIAALCREVTDADTERSFLVEREVLTQLAADCSDTAAAWCRQEQGSLILDVMYAGNRHQVKYSEDDQEQSTDVVSGTVQFQKVQEAEAGGRTEAQFYKTAEKTGKEVRIRQDRETGKRDALFQAGLAMAKEAAETVKGKKDI